jgi:N utilization substance protein B
MTETAGKGRPTDRRSAARLLAVQALFQSAVTGAPADAVHAEFLEHRIGEAVDGLKTVTPDRALFGELLRGVSAEANALDDMIAGVLDEEWTIERLETLLLVIMRAGVFELSERPSVPARVVVNEYVDLAHAFFSGKEPGMVNGLLDRLARSLRIEEFEEDGGG